MFSVKVFRSGTEYAPGVLNLGIFLHFNTVSLSVSDLEIQLIANWLLF